MSNYDKIFESLQSKVTSGELTIEAASVLNDIAYDAYVQEGALSPLKDKVAKIKEIKDAKPDEYDGPEEVKAFVDKNFTDISKAAELLQKEPDEFSKNEKKYLATVAISMITFIAGMMSGVGMVVGLIGYFTMFISSIVYMLVTNARAHDDTEAMKNLSKIKTSLKKVNKDKLPDEYKKKISKMIQDIDDAETDIYSKLKKVSESAEDAYNKVFEVIQESFDSEEMTEEEANDWNTTAYEKCFTTTESVDDFSMADIMKVIDHELTEKAKAVSESTQSEVAKEVNDVPAVQKKSFAQKKELSADTCDCNKSDKPETKTPSKKELKKSPTEELAKKRELEKPEKVKEVVTKESVDDLKLRVYEAHAEGIITEAEKDTYLEYLNK